VLSTSQELAQQYLPTMCFAVLSTSQELAQQYLPTMTYLGPR